MTGMSNFDLFCPNPETNLFAVRLDDGHFPSDLFIVTDVQCAELLRNFQYGGSPRSPSMFRVGELRYIATAMTQRITFGPLSYPLRAPDEFQEEC